MLGFPTDYDDLPQGFRREACFTLDYARDRLLHCLRQLTDEQLWWRPDEHMNAVGNIVLHVCGNMRQWIVRNLTGQADARDRPAEFACREVIPGRELIAKLEATVAEAKAAITGADDAELLRVRFVQVAECTGMGAVWHSVAHLEGHAQEVVYITRLQLRDDYAFQRHY